MQIDSKYREKQDIVVMKVSDLTECELTDYNCMMYTDICQQTETSSFCCHPRGRSNNWKLLLVTGKALVTPTLFYILI